MSTASLVACENCGIGFVPKDIEEPWCSRCDEAADTPDGEAAGTGYEALLDGVRDAADWFNGYLGWLDHNGEEIPEGANELYERLNALVEQHGGW